MIIKFNSNNVKKIRNKKVKLGCLLAAGTLAATLLTGCNRTVFDTKYAFDKALVLGDDASIVMDVADWLDFEGEQIQLITKDNFALLTSSFDTNCFYGNSESCGIKTVAENALSEEGEVTDLSKSDSTSFYNKDFFDTQWAFNKSMTFNGDRALVLSVLKWRDYEGEQLQVITEDGLVLNLCSYNTKLAFDAKSDMKATDFASYYVGSDGKVTDLSSASHSPLFNYDMIDTKYGYNKAIILKDKQAVILPVKEWCDYEGEQLQLKIENGPTIVTAAYDTILLNDTESNTKAQDVASSLADNVIDYTAQFTDQKRVVFNQTLIDLNYGFSNAILSNDNSATSFPISKWGDYEGEQLQIKLSTGDTLLASSMLLDLLSGGNRELNATTIASSYVDASGKTVDSSNGNTTTPVYNQYIIDTQVKFKYALKVVDGNVTIIPLKSWQDFYNTDGKKGRNKFPFKQSTSFGQVSSGVLKTFLEDDEEEEEEEKEEKRKAPNCEQIQLILPDGTTIVTTAYDTVLVDNSRNIKEVAEMLRGPSGVISDLTPYVGEPSTSIWNMSIYDTKYHFTHAILLNGSTAQVFPINNWLDFEEGEQLQLNLKDSSGFLTSFVNTTLVSPASEFIEETIAAAFNGTLENDKPVIKTYK